MKYVGFVLCCCCFLVPMLLASQRAQPIYPFEDPTQELWFEQLGRELRCPKCQNQNISDSNASIALDLRLKTYELLQLGYDKDGVVDYMTTRYGQYIVYEPTLTFSTFFLWALPCVTLIIGGLILWQQKGRTHEVISFSKEEQTRLRQLTKGQPS